MKNARLFGTIWITIIGVIDKKWLYPAFQISPLTGDENLHHNGQSTGVAVRDFWRWSASDLANNALRGVLAEWIVARALNISKGVRTEWDAYDLVTPNKVSIEVKSAAYLQSWGQNGFSDIQFGIAPTRALGENTNIYGEAQRQAQIYVFCLLHHQEKSTLDPLNLEQWTFYLLNTQVLNEKLGTQKKLAFARLLELSPRSVRWDEIAACVEELSETN